MLDACCTVIEAHLIAVLPQDHHCQTLLQQTSRLSLGQVSPALVDLMNRLVRGALLAV
jgi:hypothetical protein